MRRAFHGPSRCCLCHENVKDIDNLFLHCSVVVQVWTHIIATLKITHKWEGSYIADAWHRWWNEVATLKDINPPLIVCWGIWLNKNYCIFQDALNHGPTTCNYIAAIYNLIPDDPKQQHAQVITLEVINKSFPWAYFDGSAQAVGYVVGGLCSI